jgi:transposase
LARGTLRNKREELARFLQGRIAPHQRFMLRQILDHIDYLDQTIIHLEEEMDIRLRLFADMLARLQSAPGIQLRNAQNIAAALPNLSFFPNAHHLASWAGLCPGNNESAGKRRSGRLRKDNEMLREALVEASWAAIRKRDTYLGVTFYRLAARRGRKRAIIAVAHALLISIYAMLTREMDYVELGPTYLDERRREYTKRNLARRLEALGYVAQLEPVSLAA